MLSCDQHSTTVCYLQQCCVREAQEWKMQVDVDDWSVLILPGGQDHLKGTEAERLNIHTHRE